MPLTFRKSWQILPGVRFNLNRKSHSWTFGSRGGPHYTTSSTGRRTTSMNLPGPFGFRSTSTSASRRREAAELQARKEEALARREARREARRQRRAR